MSKWHKVDEKLPENTDDLLIYDGYNMCEGYYSEVNKIFSYWNLKKLTYQKPTNKITHWRELPRKPGCN